MTRTADDDELSPLPPAGPGAPGSCHRPFKLTTKMPNRPGGDQPTIPPQTSRGAQSARPEHSTLPVALSDPRTKDQPSPWLRRAGPDSSPCAPPHHHHRQPRNPSATEARGGLPAEEGGSAPRAASHCFRWSGPKAPGSVPSPALQGTPRKRKPHHSSPTPRPRMKSGWGREPGSPKSSFAL